MPVMAFIRDKPCCSILAMNSLWNRHIKPAAGSQDSVQFTHRADVIEHMFKYPMTEDEIERAIGYGNLRDIGTDVGFLIRCAIENGVSTSCAFQPAAQLVFRRDMQNILTCDKLGMVPEIVKKRRAA